MRRRGFRRRAIGLLSATALAAAALWVLMELNDDRRQAVEVAETPPAAPEAGEETASTEVEAEVEAEVAADPPAEADAPDAVVVVTEEAPAGAEAEAPAAIVAATEGEVAEADDEADAPGLLAYRQHCAACHGPAAEGLGDAPALVAPAFAAGGYDDEALVRAVREGAPPHHDRFRDISAAGGVTTAELESIIVYLRALQLEAGIE